MPSAAGCSSDILAFTRATCATHVTETPTAGKIGCAERHRAVTTNCWSSSRPYGSAKLRKLVAVKSSYGRRHSLARRRATKHPKMCCSIVGNLVDLAGTVRSVYRCVGRGRRFSPCLNLHPKPQEMGKHRNSNRLRSSSALPGVTARVKSMLGSSSLGHDLLTRSRVKLSTPKVG